MPGWQAAGTMIKNKKPGKIWLQGFFAFIQLFIGGVFEPHKTVVDVE